MITTSPVPGFITVDELKTHLNKTSATDDAELAGFVSAACSMVVERIGHVSVVDATVDVAVHRGRAVLPDRPVVAVTTVVDLPGESAVVAADPVADVQGWTLRPGGVLEVDGYHRRVRVTYTAGRDPLPGDVRLAGLELAAHLWKSSQLNASGGRPNPAGMDDLALRGVGYALPYRVRELLGLGKLPTDEILVG